MWIRGFLGFDDEGPQPDAFASVRYTKKEDVFLRLANLEHPNVAKRSAHECEELPKPPRPAGFFERVPGPSNHMRGEEALESAYPHACARFKAEAPQHEVRRDPFARHGPSDDPLQRRVRLASNEEPRSGAFEALCDRDSAALGPCDERDSENE
jgi:hypothetical protein